MEPTGLPWPNFPRSFLTRMFFEAMIPFIFSPATVTHQGAGQWALLVSGLSDSEIAHSIPKGGLCFISYTSDSLSSPGDICTLHPGQPHPQTRPEQGLR